MLKELFQKSWLKLAVLSRHRGSFLLVYLSLLTLMHKQQGSICTG
jgi:hypothetical protein